MRYEMKSIAIWPVVKITFLVSLVAGFCAGLILALIFIPMMAMMPALGMPDGELDTAKFSMGALIIFLPIFYALFIAVVNTIMSLIATGCYNLFAKWGGGLEYELVPVGEFHEQRPSERVVYGTPAYTQPVPPPPPPPPQQNNSNEEGGKRTLGTGYE